MAKILAIDDNFDNIVVLRALLSDAFPQVEFFSAQSGKKGIEICYTEKPDVILLDIVMPLMDGFEVCRLLKADTITKTIPIVMLTAARTDKESRIIALEVGADAFLTKPVDESELTAQIRAMLRIKESEDLKQDENDRLKHLVNVRTEALQKELKERKRAEKDLKLALLKAQEADKLKSAFLANMSHEIRTPLNSIIGFSELLKDPEIGPENYSEFVSMISASGNSLLAIINDIMDISKIEAGQIRLFPTEFSVQQLLGEIYREFSFKALEKDIELRFDSSNPVGEIVVKSDEEKLRQILVNFLSNALKFTEKGFIEIGFRQVENFIHFWIKDTGIGIPEEFHKVIFDRFRQVESADTRRFGGNGLGLAISKNLVELLGGQIGIDSEKEKGSTFYFTIPINDKFEMSVEKFESLKKMRFKKF